MKAGKFKFIGLVLGLMVFGGGVLETRGQIAADVAIMQNLRDNHGFGAAFGWSTTTNPCTSNQNWAGVSCRQQRVSSISLGCGSTPLPAPFPGTEIAGLTALDNLELRNCWFSPQPASNFAALDTMTQLVKIRLDTNPGITGTFNEMFPQGLNPTRFPSLQIFWLWGASIGGQIPDGVMQFGNTMSFNLLQMRLSGTLPATGNSSQFELFLNGNALEGVVPDYIRNRTNLTYLRYNKFDVANTPPGNIDTLDPEWRTTQTVPPTNVQATANGAGTARLTWTPIAYTAHGGYYEVLSSTAPGGPYVSRGTTANAGAKTATGLTVSGLPAGTNYFVVRTFTPAHTGETATCVAGNVTLISVYLVQACGDGIIRVAPNNPNDLTSVNSAEVSANVAPPLTVTKTADTNDGVCDAADCSLREAIAAANAANNDDSIEFAPTAFAGTQTVTLTLGELLVANNGSLTINGTGANLLSISGNNQSRVFSVAANANLTLNGLTVTNGRVSGGGPQGGGIFTQGGNVTLNHCAVTNNSLISSLTGQGAGIYSLGFFASSAVVINNSTISDNYINSQGQGQGGGIWSFGLTNPATLTVTNSTISGNSISNSQNSGSASGAGIFIAQSFETSATLTLTNSTVSGNRATAAGLSVYSIGGGIYNDATVNARNSIIAGNTVSSPNGSVAAPDFRGNLTSQGYNLIGNTQDMTITGDTMTNILNQNARLAPLGFYGGATQTHALLSGSPAINAVAVVQNTPPNDQRGASRIGNADIGAFELNNSTNGGNFVAELPKGTTGVPYNYTLVPNNGAFTYSQTGGSLPTGINLTTSLAPNAVVAVGGTAAMGGIYNFEVTATDGANTNVTNYRVQFVAPVAAGVSIGGRVMASDGRGIRNAIVTLTLQNGETIQTRTGTFGYYRFDDIEAGQTVVLSVVSKLFQFTPQVVSVTEDLAELDFVAPIF